MDKRRATTIELIGDEHYDDAEELSQATEELSVMIATRQDEEPLVWTLTVLEGPQRGATYPLRGSTLIGRENYCDISLDERSISRRHVRIDREDDGYTLVDLGSRNGTFVNGRRLEGQTELRPADRIQLGSTIVLSISVKNNRELTIAREQYNKAVQDALTGAYNRHYALDWLERELASARRRGEPLAIFALDIDHFKRINDTLGHACGDAVLVAFVKTIETKLRADSIVARFGGEEFIVAARHIGSDEARGLAERLRIAIEQEPVVFEGRTVRFTASLGYLTSDRHPSCHLQELLQLADRALYVAKHQGRNQAISA